MKWFIKAREQAKRERVGADFYCDGTMEDTNSKLNRMLFWEAFKNLLKKKKDARNGENNGYKG